MQSVKRSQAESQRRLVRRSLTLMLLLPVVVLTCISVTGLPASSQTTTTEPTTTTTTAPTTTTTWQPCQSPLTDEAWAACRTQHDVENLRADVLLGGAILIALAAAIFVARLFQAAS